MRDGSWVYTIRSFDPIITQIQRTEVTDPNQYFYQYDSQTFSETFSESLQSGHAEILSVFPMPIWNLYKGFIILKGDDLLVLRVLEIQGSKGQRGRFSFRCEHFGLCCESFAFAVNILVCAVSYLLSCYCCEYLGLCCELFGIAENILVCAVSYLLLL